MTAAYFVTGTDSLIVAGEPARSAGQERLL